MGKLILFLKGLSGILSLVIFILLMLAAFKDKDSMSENEKLKYNKTNKVILLLIGIDFSLFIIYTFIF